MKRYGYVVLAAIAVLLVSLFVSTSAQAYPDARIALTVNHQVIYAGDSFRATGSTNIACSLDLEWNHVLRHSGPTKEFQTSFVAPTVTAVTSIPLTGVCRLAGTSAGKAGAPTTVKRSLDVTVLPRASGSAAVEQPWAAALRAVRPRPLPGTTVRTCPGPADPTGSCCSPDWSCCSPVPPR